MLKIPQLELWNRQNPRQTARIHASLMAHPQLHCHTGMIWSSALVRAPSSLSFVRTRPWPPWKLSSTKKFSVPAGKRDTILVVHVQRICEVHDWAIRSYYQQTHGSSKADATTSKENLGEQVYAWIIYNPFVISCWSKVKVAQTLSKMSKPTALHTEGTAQVSECLNTSGTDKKLYQCT